MITDKELTEELKIARISSLVTLGISILNLGVIMFFCTLVLKGGR